MAYVGEYRERLRDGHGAYRFPSGGFRYEGDWKRGQMHGRGVFSLPDGGSYEGAFVNGEIDGVGLRRWPDGSTYNGQFQRGERHGEGVHIAVNGEVYEGHWMNNQRQGLGELRMADRSVYRGNFHRHKPHGNGRITFGRDASWYEGDWVEGKICGRGVLTDAQGTKLYEGEWLNGQRCGCGAGFLSTPSGARVAILFDGVWTNDLPLTSTTMLGFKTAQSAPAVSINTEESNGALDTQYEDAPSLIALDKNTGSQLPIIAVASLHVSSTDATTTIVKGESRRLLRLRLFQGSPPLASTQQVPPTEKAPDEIREEAAHPMRYQFAIVEESPLIDQSEQQASVDAEHVSAAEAEPECPTQVETTVDEVIIPNAGGVAVFVKLALPASSPPGVYHLICENVEDEGELDPIYLVLQLSE